LQKQGWKQMKYVFTMTSLGIFGLGCSATEAPVEIEGRQAQARPIAAMDSPSVDEARAVMAHPDCTYGVQRWGRFDQAGQSNTQNRRKMLEAAAFIGSSSKSITLGHAYDEDMPTFPSPALAGYHLDIPEGTHRAALGTLVAHEELITSEIGQVGTEIDALGHMCFLHDGASDPSEADCYGGYKERDIYDPKGLLALGVEHIKPYFTRGILLDVQRYVNRNKRLAPGTAITLEMIIQTMDAEHLTIADIREGDVVLVRTGQEELWKRPDLGDYYGSTPGINLEVAKFFASRCVGNVGADNWPVEVQPSVDGGFVPVHELNLTVAGLPQQENLSLRELSSYLATLHDENRYIFAYIYTPVPIAGSSGSPGVPLAIR
jgi:kynurenine formamidase